MGMIGNLVRLSRSELDRFCSNSAQLEDRVFNADLDDESVVDIDKTWDGIIFLLTGAPLGEAFDHDLAKVLFSNQLVDEQQDLGYGPAHYLTPEQVRELNAKIAEISNSDLAARFDADKMTALGVYPSIWDEGDEAFEYLLDGFEAVRKAFKVAADNDEAIVTFLS